MLTSSRCTILFYLLSCNYVKANLLGNLFSDFSLSDLDASRVSKEYQRDVETDDWKGRWMPSRPGEPTQPPKIFPALQSNRENEFSTNTSHLGNWMSKIVQMGSVDKCDNGKTNLTIDWDNSPVDYTCYDHMISPYFKIRPIQYCERIPQAYVATHICMNEPIEYDEDLPLYGNHRPVWPVYGEYKFLPRQRWLHSLEHGAVVLLYHPCANPQEVAALKKIVSRCIRRHVISPYNRLDKDRPLALLAWGCRLTMSYVQPKVVEQFIKQKALRGYEEISSDGDYKLELISKAKIVSDLDDSNLCPN